SGGGQTQIAFNPDGTRYAYVGRSGQELVVIVDGKELMRASAAINKIEPVDPSNAGAIRFTSNGKHFYFGLATHRDTSNAGSYKQFVWDGQVGPKYAMTDSTFSPDGDHFAYYLHIPPRIPPNTRENQMDVLLVDGKPAGYLAGTPQFTGDGK